MKQRCLSRTSQRHSTRRHGRQSRSIETVSSTSRITLITFLSDIDHRFSFSVSLRIRIDRGETGSRSWLSDEIRRGHVSIESNCRCEELVIGGEEMLNVRFL